MTSSEAATFCIVAAFGVIFGEEAAWLPLSVARPALSAATRAHIRYRIPRIEINLVEKGGVVRPREAHRACSYGLSLKKPPSFRSNRRSNCVVWG